MMHMSLRVFLSVSLLASTLSCSLIELDPDRLERDTSIAGDTPTDGHSEDVAGDDASGRVCEVGVDPCCEPTGHTISWYDPDTNLCWEDPPREDRILWYAASTYCDELGPGWGLPTIDQLRTLVRNCSNAEPDGACGVTDPDCLSASSCHSTCEACTHGLGPGVYGCYWVPSLSGFCGAYWSCSIDADDSLAAWCVMYETAFVSQDWRTNDAFVRCVREN